MFGKRKLKEAAIQAEPPAPPRPSPTKPALRSPAEAAKPQPVPPPPRPVRVRRPRGGLLSMTSEALTLGLFAGAAITFGILVVSREVDATGPLPADKIVLIPKGAGTSEIAEVLAREGVIANPTMFEAYAYLKRSKGQLKAGEFEFKARATIAEAVDTLISGKAILHSITLPEGLTSTQIVDRLRENDVLAGDVSEIPREGSLLPDTYRFERGTTRRQVINLMQAAERDVLNKAWARRAPDLAIRTPQELVILASIVEKETGKSEERARVAGVFVNRLARRMKLQSDPTIVYGLVGGKGTLGRGILKSEIEKPTAYNTYVIEGLPPGPIANPGRAALEAVANPAKSKELYFVADGSGGHAFAETYDQHLRNVARWRQLEGARQAASPGGPDVDRAPAPSNPDQRTSLDGPAETRGPGRAVAFDAVEGTARDPLRNQGWDLTSAKAVPSFGTAGGELAGQRAASQPSGQRRQASRPARRASQEADSGAAAQNRTP